MNINQSLSTSLHSPLKRNHSPKSSIGSPTRNFSRKCSLDTTWHHGERPTTPSFPQKRTRTPWSKKQSKQVERRSSLNLGLPAVPFLDFEKNRKNGGIKDSTNDVFNSSISSFQLVSPNPRPKKKAGIVAPGSPRTTAFPSGDLPSMDEFDYRQSPRFRSNIPCMSRNLPSTKESQSFVLKYDNVSTFMDSMSSITSTSQSNNNRGTLIVENAITGELVATLEHGSKDKRILRDAKGNRCATIVQHQKFNGQNRFKIQCDKAMSAEHRRSKDTGHYTWAEVKNSTSLGMKISLKVRDNAGSTSTSAPDQAVSSPPVFETESFGNSLFKWGTSRGHLIRQSRGFRRGEGESASPCARLTYAGDSLGLVVGPNMDLCLALSYAAIIDDIVENRML